MTSESKDWKKFSIDDAMKLQAPTEGFLCPLSANTYGIDFQSFTIRDHIINKIFFKVQKPKEMPKLPPDFDMDKLRMIEYKFPRSFVECKTVATSLVFKVGERPVKNFVMVERHYFKGKLIKSWEFKVDFCMPNSVNNWEAMYDLPPMKKELVDEIVSNQHPSESDSFYFVDGKLVMHNKAKYTYYDDRE
uniref:GMP phosphodiesterase delta subunit domain-containing protein n=1 Tax=Lotharella globosa TaxID=91324 RepID=A0A6V3S3I7_9EUKA|mmetsp:Transcript_16127/g.31519  ORF Transcript_16127/g.31519 Transcript_16127/m.31519 type:complete len:190 (+) Transcript_16127:65-634(+)|eukprot:CAMPEP_0167772738 /NCGR_PEP_ID=MMETSP0111_2-20121227/1014_1 /TAXON_ID=91324 /ORGANISM="Lotharella globosa, Strain CCCM811" /LENGTH=189 /DNA_ID=CAMNT_0007662263 /DNA_START=58 /DNA_END=627 /DNA_ORIENTATION=-